jgi:hypothetical protein
MSMMVEVRKEEGDLDHGAHDPDHDCDRPPHEKVGVCLLRSYRGILDEARMYKHTHKYIIP